MLVRSLRDIRKLNLKVTAQPDAVQITNAGSHFKARFRGCSNFVFGTTAEHAKQRLLSSAAKRWGIAPAPITNFEKQLLKACRAG